jgi:hypothetical protein
MFDIDELERAAEVVHKVLPETPQIRWPLLLQEQKIVRNKRVALIHSGSNIDSGIFAAVLAG